MNTKAESLRSITSDGSRITKRERVMQAVCLNQRLHKNGISRSLLADITGLRLSSVCGRVNELLASGDIEECGVERDSETGKMVKLLRPVKIQMEMFK